MSADKAQPAPENAEAKSVDSSDANANAKPETVEQVQEAQANDAATQATDSLRADSGVAGSENTAVGQDATENAAKGTDANAEATGDAAEATNLQDKLLDDSKPESLEELRKLAPERLTAAQRARLGLPALDIQDPVKLAMMGAKHGLRPSERSRTYSHKDVELDLNGTKVKFDDIDVGFTKLNTVADVSLQLGDNARTETIEGVGSRHTIEGKDGGQSQVIEGKDGALHIKTADGKYMSMYPGDDFSISDRAGKVVEGPEAQQAFESQAEQFDKLGASAYDYGMVSTELKGKVATNDGSHDLVTVSQPDAEGNIQVNTTIPDSATITATDGDNVNATLQDGTKVITLNGDTTIMNPNGSLIKVDGSSGEITEVPAGDEATSQFEAVEANFETNVEPKGGDGGFDIFSWDDWKSAGSSVGSFLWENSGLSTAYDIGSGILDLGSEFPEMLGDDVCHADPNFDPTKDFEYFSENFDTSGFGQKVDQVLDNGGDIGKFELADAQFDGSQSSGSTKFDEFGNVVERKVNETLVDAVSDKADQAGEQLERNLVTDKYKVEGDGSKTSADIVNDGLNGALSKVEGKDGSTVDRATLDNALANRLEGPDVVSKQNDKGEIVQVDEKTGMQRIEHGDGSVTVKYGEGDNAVAVTKNSEQTEYVTKDGAVIEKADGTFYSSIGHEMEGYGNIHRLKVNDARLTGDIISKYGQDFSVVEAADGNKGSDAGRYQIQTDREGDKSFVRDEETNTNYHVCPETNRLMAVGPDGQAQPVDDANLPANVTKNEDGSYEFRQEDGKVVTLNHHSAEISDALGLNSTGVEVLGGTTLSTQNITALPDLGQFENMTPDQLQSAFSEQFKNMTPEQRRERMEAFSKLSPEQQRERMQRLRELAKNLSPEQQRQFRQMMRDARREAARARAEGEASPDGAPDISISSKTDPAGKTTSKIENGEGETLSTSSSVDGVFTVTDHTGPDGPTELLSHDREAGTVSTENLSRTADGDITHIPSGTTFAANGDILDANGGSIYDYSSGSFGDSWSDAGFSGGRTEAQQAALEAAAESKANTAVGQAQAVAAKVAAAVQSGNVSAIMCSMGEVAAAYGAISGAVACAIDAGDYGLAGMLNLQTSQVNAAAGSVVATTVKVQDVNRMMGPLEGDSVMAKALASRTGDFSNSKEQYKHVARMMGRDTEQV